MGRATGGVHLPYQGLLGMLRNVEPMGHCCWESVLFWPLMWPDGDNGEGDFPNEGHVFKDSDNCFTVWCTGRTGCDWMMAQLRLQRRQDLFTLLLSLVRPSPDTVAYVQKGENDICDDGKEIAEAEDWESTVKENRSSLPPCLIHPISLHNFSTVISSPSVNNTLDGAIFLRYRLQELGEPSLPVFIRQSNQISICQ
eukprot:Em0004g274a